MAPVDGVVVARGSVAAPTMSLPTTVEVSTGQMMLGSPTRRVLRSALQICRCRWLFAPGLLHRRPVASCCMIQWTMAGSLDLECVDQFSGTPWPRVAVMVV